MAFWHALELSTDAAQAINYKGQNPSAVFVVVMMFVNEQP
jgi:hypothetical protein